MKPLRVGELFAGIGGIGLGLERTGGFEVVWQVENNDYATKVLEKNCQDISVAKQRGEGLDGKRSGLFYEVVRIVDRLRPTAVLLENSSMLLSRGLDIVL